MTIELPANTIRSLLERSFSLYGDLPAIAFVGETPKSYAQVKLEIESLATYLLSRNIQKGDKIAILGENSPQWVIAYLTVTMMGAVAVPILTGFPDTDTRHILRNSESVAIFISEKQQSKIEGLGKSHLHTIFSLEDFAMTPLKKRATPHHHTHASESKLQPGMFSKHCLIPLRKTWPSSSTRRGPRAIPRESC